MINVKEENKKLRKQLQDHLINLKVDIGFCCAICKKLTGKLKNERYFSEEMQKQIQSKQMLHKKYKKQLL